MPCSSKRVIEQSNTDTAPKAKHKPSCGWLTRLYSNPLFEQGPGDTWTDTTDFTSVRQDPGSQGLCSFTLTQSSAVPNPRCFPNSSSHYPGSCWEQISILTGHSSHEGARSGFTPCPMAKYYLKVAESLHWGRVTRIPNEISGQGVVLTPGSCGPQEQASPAPEETLRAWALAARVALPGLSCPPALGISG